TFLTVGIRLSPPGPVGPGRDDGPVEADQAHLVGGHAGDDPPSPRPRSLMAVGHVDREPVDRVVSGLLEVAGGVSVTEIARPAAQEPVEVLHDLLDWQR